MSLYTPRRCCCCDALRLTLLSFHSLFFIIFFYIQTFSTAQRNTEVTPTTTAAAHDLCVIIITQHLNIINVPMAAIGLRKFGNLHQGERDCCILLMMLGSLNHCTVAQREWFKSFFLSYFWKCKILCSDSRSSSSYKYGMTPVIAAVTVLWRVHSTVNYL